MENNIGTKVHRVKGRNYIYEMIYFNPFQSVPTPCRNRFTNWQSAMNVKFFWSIRKIVTSSVWVAGSFAGQVMSDYAIARIYRREDLLFCCSLWWVIYIQSHIMTDVNEYWNTFNILKYHAHRRNLKRVNVVTQKVRSSFISSFRHAYTTLRAFAVLSITQAIQGTKEENAERMWERKCRIRRQNGGKTEGWVLKVGLKQIWTKTYKELHLVYITIFTYLYLLTKLEVCYSF